MGEDARNILRVGSLHDLCKALGRQSHPIKFALDLMFLDTIILEVQAKMMQVGAELYAAYDSQSSGSSDELHFSEGDVVVICNPGKESKSLKGGTNGDEEEEEEENCCIGEGWCLARNKRTDEEGYAPKNYLSVSENHLYLHLN